MAGLLAGLILGVLDVVLLLIFPSLRGTPHLPRWIWLALPWTYATVCCLAATVVCWTPLRRLTAASIWLVGPSVLLLSRLHNVKMAFQLSSMRYLALCFGLAAAGAVFLVVRPPAFAPLRHRWRYLAGAAASLFLILFCATALDPREWLPTRAAENRQRRNVVLVFLDTVRWDDSLGPNSGMPHLKDLAAQSVTFDNAWAPAPWTLPSHYGVLSGLEPWTVPFHYGLYRFATDPTLAARVQARGYRTAAILANPLLSPSTGFAHGFDEFTASRDPAVCRTAYGDLLSRTWTQDLPRSPVCGWFLSSDVTPRAIRFLRRTKRPYFLALNYLDAHEPYYVPPQCRDRSFQQVPRAEREQFMRLFFGFDPVPTLLASRLHNQYREDLSCLDRSLGELFATLRADPEYASTTIIVVADHGEHFGEHNLTSHGTSVYRPVVHVPLMVRAPGLAPAHVADAVSVVDTYSVILQVTDARRSAETLRLLDRERRLPARSFFEVYYGNGRRDSGFSVVLGNRQLIRWKNGREALFDEQGNEIPLGAESEMLTRARDLIDEARRQKRGSTTFNALGYLR